MCICVLRVLYQTTSTPRKGVKRVRKPKSSGPSDFCKIFAICLGNSYISAENILSVALINCDEMTQLFSGESSFYSMVFDLNCIQKVLCCLLKTSLYFTSPINRSIQSFVPTMIEGILSSFISCICLNIHTLAFVLLFRLVDVRLSRKLVGIIATMSFDQRRYLKAASIF